MVNVFNIRFYSNAILIKVIDFNILQAFSTSILSNFWLYRGVLFFLGRATFWQSVQVSRSQKLISSRSNKQQAFLRTLITPWLDASTRVLRKMIPGVSRFSCRRLFFKPQRYYLHCFSVQSASFLYTLRMCKKSSGVCYVNACAAMSCKRAIFHIIIENQKKISWKKHQVGGEVLRFVFGRHIPKESKTQLLTVSS